MEMAQTVIGIGNEINRLNFKHESPTHQNFKNFPKIMQIGKAAMVLDFILWYLYAV